MRYVEEESLVQFMLGVGPDWSWHNIKEPHMLPSRE
jgi:hypothetical protein